MVRNDHCSCRGDPFVPTAAVVWYSLQSIVHLRATGNYKGALWGALAALFWLLIFMNSEPAIR
jgi:hypothetical protein